MKRGTTVLLALLVALITASCGGDDREPMLVMAAASLADAFSQMEVEFEAQHPDIDVQLSLAGSASLREQILQGAPADVFASANELVMQQIADAGEVEEANIFATNELALAVPRGNPAGVSGIADLATEALLVGLCAEGVPCGDFARIALEQVGVTPAVDTNERDVRSLVTKIAAGELDAGIVYRTDVQASTDLESVALPTSIDVAIKYPIALLTESGNPRGAQLFIAFVQTPDGQTILASHGFGQP